MCDEIQILNDNMGLYYQKCYLKWHLVLYGRKTQMLKQVVFI